MPRNVEIKARVDDLAVIECRLRALAVRERHELLQHDTFFIVPGGRLKLRRFQDGSAELIHYHRPDTPGPKLSQFERVPCTDPVALGRVLGAALGVRGVVAKRRSVCLVGQTRIHLDSVEQLGDFVELEVVLDATQSPADGEKIARKLLIELGIDPASLQSGAYIDLLEAVPAGGGAPSATGPSAGQATLAACATVDKEFSAASVTTGEALPATSATADEAIRIDARDERL